MPPEASPARSTPHVRHGSNVGQPLTRRDGVLKVTGGARFAADNHPAQLLYAVLAVSSIARGRVTFLDVPAAMAHPGVVEVMTPANRPPLAQDPDAKTTPFMFRLDVLQNDLVRYANQSIAVVIAETLEAATEGAALLSPRYDAEPARTGLDSTESFVPAAVRLISPPEERVGDVEAGLADATHARRRNLRDTGAVSQRDGAPRHRRGVGRRQAVDRHAEPGARHGARPHRRSVRTSCGKRPHPQPIPRRRFRLEGPVLRAAGPRHPGGAFGRAAGQARAATRPDVRPGGPSTARRVKGFASASTTRAA